jgi:hypothetical protein
MENLFEHAKQVIEAGIAQLGLNFEECYYLKIIKKN